ncbi:hypothetical protein ACFLU5_09645 [Bacteroidota bacterium]
MADIKCETCAMRAKYDNNPKSFIGRFWKWHIKFCPGWKAYLQSVSDEKRLELFSTYGERKI